MNQKNDGFTGKEDNMNNFEKFVSAWDNKEETVKQVAFQLPSCIKTEEGANIYADLFVNAKPQVP